MPPLSSSPPRRTRPWGRNSSMRWTPAASTTSTGRSIRCLSPGVRLKGGHEKSTPIRAVSLEAEIISQASQSRCRAILGQQSLCAEEGALPLLIRQQPRESQLRQASASSSFCLCRRMRQNVLAWVPATTTSKGFSPTDEMIGAQLPGRKKSIPCLQEKVHIF